jgi:hypothetical protein
MEDIEMLDSGSQRPDETGTSNAYIIQGNWCNRNRQVTVVCGGVHTYNAKTWPENRQVFTTAIHFLITNEAHIQEILVSLENEGILDHLRNAKNCLKVGMDGASVVYRYLLDCQGNELMFVSSEHEEALWLLWTMHALFISEEPSFLSLCLRGYNDAVYYVHFAQGVLRRWLAQWYAQSHLNQM